MQGFRRAGRGLYECSAGTDHIRLSVYCSEIDHHVAGHRDKAAGSKLFNDFEFLFGIHLAHVYLIDAVYVGLADSGHEDSKATVDLSCYARAVVGLKVTCPSVSVAQTLKCLP